MRQIREGLGFSISGLAANDQSALNRGIIWKLEQDAHSGRPHAYLRILGVLGRELVRWRQARGLSREQLAAITRIHVVELGRLEAGDLMSIGALARLGAYLHRIHAAQYQGYHTRVRRRIQAAA